MTRTLQIDRNRLAPHAFRAFLKNPHPIAVEWVIRNIFEPIESGININIEGGLAPSAVQNPAPEITTRLLKNDTVVQKVVFPHILGNPSDDVVELIEDYITFTLPSEWSKMNPCMQNTIIKLILENPNKAGAKALVFTRSVFDQLSNIDRVKLASHLADDECVVTFQVEK